MTTIIEALVTQLRESKLNPRRKFSEKKLEEYAESMRQVGVLSPLVVRSLKGPPTDNGAPVYFEIVAGAMRYRAAKLAGLDRVPVLVRTLTDEQFMEIALIENSQRTDISPLEEAAGFAQLAKAGKSADYIGAKIGHPARYVYDRLKLLDLIGELKELLDAELITLGHAIELARLTPQQQKLCLGDSDSDSDSRSALFEYEGGHLFHEIAGAADGRPEIFQRYDERKVVSLRELRVWIDNHCRFVPEDPVIATLFPDTVAEVAKAKEDDGKVIQITYNHFIDPAAKEGNQGRIYTEVSWKLADGSKSAKECDKSVLGLIVVGPEYGKTKRVCIDKGCKVHWAAERLQRERSRHHVVEKVSKAQEAADAERAEGDRVREVWKTKTPEIFAATVAAVKKLRVSDLGDMASTIFAHSEERKRVRNVLGNVKSAEDYLRLLVLMWLTRQILWSWGGLGELSKYSKRLKLDYRAFVKKEPDKKADRGAGYDEPTCFECHCTELSPCVEGCGWKKLNKKTKRGLCTACAGKGVKWQDQPRKEDEPMAAKKAKKRPASKKKSASSVKAAEAKSAA